MSGEPSPLRAGELPEEALVVRGGRNTPETFVGAPGVVITASGTVLNVSVNSAAGMTVTPLSAGVPHARIGVTTVGRIRALGGTVVPAPSRNNPYHCLLGGLTPEQACALFTPTRPNPNQVG